MTINFSINLNSSPANSVILSQSHQNLTDSSENIAHDPHIQTRKIEDVPFYHSYLAIGIEIVFLIVCIYSTLELFDIVAIYLNLNCLESLIGSDVLFLSSRSLSLVLCFVILCPLHTLNLRHT